METKYTPSLLAIDSQSVKCVQFVSEDTGIDRGKRINGRKRTILVDTLGIPWAVKVTSAGTSDNQTGIQALEQLKGKVPRLRKIFCFAFGRHKYFGGKRTSAVKKGRYSSTIEYDSIRTHAIPIQVDFQFQAERESYAAFLIGARYTANPHQSFGSITAGVKVDINAKYRWRQRRILERRERRKLLRREREGTLQ